MFLHLETLPDSITLVPEDGTSSETNSIILSVGIYLFKMLSASNFIGNIDTTSIVQDNPPHPHYEEKAFHVYKQCTYSLNYMKYEIFLCIIGMINTFVIAVVFTRPSMRSSSMNRLLVAIEISNFISTAAHLLATIMVFSCPDVQAGTRNASLFELGLSLHVPSINFANMVTPVVGVWRFVAVTWPIKAHLYLTKSLACKITVAIVITSVFYFLYIFLYHSIERSPFTLYSSDPNICYVLPNFTSIPEDFRSIQCGLFDRNVFLSIGVLVSAVPCIISIVVNSALICGLIVKKCRSAELKEGQVHVTTFAHEARTTCTLVVFLLAHVICYVCPDLFTLLVYMCPSCRLENEPFFCFFFYHFPPVIYLSFLALICYCIMSGKFRSTLWHVLRLDVLTLIAPWESLFTWTSKKQYGVKESNV